jgi:hypothetical protein
MLIRHF